MIFGRKGCNESRDWGVGIFFVADATPLRVSEQLKKQDAKKIYDEVVKEYNSDSNTMEMTIDGEDWIFIKKNISAIVLRDRMR